MAVQTSRSSLALLVSLVDRPSETLAEVAQNPRLRWVWPTILNLASIGLYMGLAAPYLVDAARKAMLLQISQMPPSQAEVVQAQMERFTSLPFVVGSGTISAVLGLFVAWVLAAAILYFGCLIAGEDLTFNTVMALVPWTWMPFALRGMVQAAWTAMRRELIQTPGLSALVSSGNPMADARNPMFAVLSQVDLFALWHLILIYAALRAATRMRTNKAAWLVGVYAVLSVLARLIPVMIGRAFGAGA